MTGNFIPELAPRHPAPRRLRCLYGYSPAKRESLQYSRWRSFQQTQLLLPFVVIAGGFSHTVAGRAHEVLKSRQRSPKWCRSPSSGTEVSKHCAPQRNYLRSGGRSTPPPDTESDMVGSNTCVGSGARKWTYSRTQCQEIYQDPDKAIRQVHESPGGTTEKVPEEASSAVADKTLPSQYPRGPRRSWTLARWRRSTPLIHSLSDGRFRSPWLRCIQRVSACRCDGGGGVRT